MGILTFEEYMNEANNTVIKAISDTIKKRVDAGKEREIKNWLESGDTDSLKIVKKKASDAGKGNHAYWILTSDGKTISEGATHSGTGAAKAAKADAEDRMKALEMLKENW